MRKPKRFSSEPRNPLVAPALHRKAGAHEITAKQDRQRLKRALQRGDDLLH